MKIIKKSLLIFLTISILQSCSKDTAQVPAYLTIPKINLVTEAGQGSNSQNINHAFFYKDDQFIGGYELPATIPVLASEPANIRIEPGIKANGLSNTPDDYPFYAAIEQEIDFAPEKEISIVPTTRYKDNVKFAMIENFNSADHIFTIDLDENTDTKISLTNEGAFEGNSAKITLTEQNNQAIIATDFFKNDLTALPQNGTPVWLEIDYKTDIEVLVGLIGIDNSGAPTEFPDFGINPKSEWNKIYFDLTNRVQLLQFIGFQIFVGAIHSGEGEKNIYLDNIKVVYFEN